MIVILDTWDFVVVVVVTIFGAIQFTARLLLVCLGLSSLRLVGAPSSRLPSPFEATLLVASQLSYLWDKMFLTELVCLLLGLQMAFLQEGFTPGSEEQDFKTKAGHLMF